MQRMKKTRDSAKPITCNTPVVNYKNDALTRKFFVKQIGKRFHFTNYLRQFSKNKSISKRITYGDLVKGWLAEETRKKKPNYQSVIGRQFKYNQFIRDFFSNEKSKTLADAIKAWKMVRGLKGQETYFYYKTKLLSGNIGDGKC